MKYLSTTLALVAAQADKLQIELYYESQCGGCWQAIDGSFKSAVYQKTFFEMAELTMVPYGNAREKGQAGTADTWDFTCQHGEIECNWNMI